METHQPFPPDAIKVREAAKLLAVDRASIYRWMRAGRLSWWRLPGGHRRVSRGEVLGLPVSSGGAPAATEAARQLTLLRRQTAETLRRFGLA